MSSSKLRRKVRKKLGIQPGKNDGKKRTIGSLQSTAVPRRGCCGKQTLVIMFFHDKKSMERNNPAL